MVRIFASVLSALALSSAVLAVPMMGRDSHASDPYASDPYASEPLPVKGATSTSAAYASATAVTEASTSTAMAHEASTTSSVMHDATSTSAAAAAPTYGSGYANWGTDLNSCVQMCQAKFGMPSGSAPPPEATPAPSATESAPATGATHTVIVAPVKGVLRYVPFAVNASVGDTVRFMWGAGPHTVTKSSALTVCNKSADASTFASGQQNASFVFDQVVNNTEPTFFYCAVATHCQKGMFGIINPPSAPAGAPTSVGVMMSTWISQNPDIGKMRTAVDAMTINTPAYNWGSNMDVSTIPAAAQQSLVENIMYTRVFYSQNTGASDGASRPDGQPLSIPPDVTTLLTGSTTPGASNSAPAGASSSPSATSAPASASSPVSVNGANSVMSSSALIAVAAIFSSLFLI